MKHLLKLGAIALLALATQRADARFSAANLAQGLDIIRECSGRSPTKQRDYSSRECMGAPTLIELLPENISNAIEELNQEIAFLKQLQAKHKNIADAIQDLHEELAQINQVKQTFAKDFPERAQRHFNMQ